MSAVCSGVRASGSMRTRVPSSTDSRICAAAAMMRLAARRRTPRDSPERFRSGREDLADRLEARVHEGGERDLPVDEVPEPVHRHHVKRVGDDLVAHRLVRPARDLAGLPRRGQDRLDGVADRAAVGDDGTGRLPWAQRPDFDGCVLHCDDRGYRRHAGISPDSFSSPVSMSGHHGGRGPRRLSAKPRVRSRKSRSLARTDACCFAAAPRLRSAGDVFLPAIAAERRGKTGGVVAERGRARCAVR